MTGPDIASGGPLALHPGQLDALRAAYRAPERPYHNWGHVGEVLRHYHRVAAGPGWSRPAEAWLAVLYHDAIHDPRRRDNEVRSARLAAAEISRWLSDADVDVGRVSRLIELTAHHGQHVPEEFGNGPDAEDIRHFLDCDMAILGAAPDVFDAYDQAIAAEYRGQVPDWLFRRNRRRFLQSLLALPRIYLSDWFHQRHDAAARANLRRILG